MAANLFAKVPYDLLFVHLANMSPSSAETGGLHRHSGSTAARQRAPVACRLSNTRDSIHSRFCRSILGVIFPVPVEESMIDEFELIVLDKASSAAQNLKVSSSGLSPLVSKMKGTS